MSIYILYRPNIITHTKYPFATILFYTEESRHHITIEELSTQALKGSMASTNLLKHAPTINPLLSHLSILLATPFLTSTLAIPRPLNMTDPYINSNEILKMKTKIAPSLTLPLDLTIPINQSYLDIKTLNTKFLHYATWAPFAKMKHGYTCSPPIVGTNVSITFVQIGIAKLNTQTCLPTISFNAYTRCFIMAHVGTYHSRPP